MGYASDLAGHLTTGAGNADAGSTDPLAGQSAGPSWLADVMKSPDPVTAFGSMLPGASAPATQGAVSDGSGSAAPNPLDTQVHGTTGAWVNGYDIVARRAIAAAPDRQAARLIATQCDADRARGMATVMQYEANSNMQQRQASFINSAQLIADKRLAADPDTLPQMLAIADKTMIHVGAGQEEFQNRVRGIMVGASMRKLQELDPQGSLDALNGSPEALARHPAIAALTESEAAQYRPRFLAAVHLAQSNGQAALMQQADAATQAYRATGSAANAPVLADFTRWFGDEVGRARFDSWDYANQIEVQKKNLAGLPSAQIESRRAAAQPGLHATARANPDSLGTAATAPAPAAEGDSGPFSLRAGGDTPDPGYEARARQAGIEQSAAAAVLQARGEDPVKAGIDAGAFGFQAGDLSAPQAALATAAARVPSAGLLAGAYGTRPVLFSNTEAQGLAQLAAGLPGKQRAAFFQQLTQKIDNPELSRATFEQIGAYDPVLAGAARLQFAEQGSNPVAAGKLDAAQLAFDGYDAMHAEGDKAMRMPPDAQMRPLALPPREGETEADTEARYGLARAIYAGLAARDRDNSGTLDPQRWQTAQWLAGNGSGTAREVGLAPWTTPSGNTEEMGGVNASGIGPSSNQLPLTPRNALDNLMHQATTNQLASFTSGNQPGVELEKTAVLDSLRSPPRNHADDQLYALNSKGEDAKTDAVPMPDFVPRHDQEKPNNEGEKPLGPGLFGKDKDGEFIDQVQGFIAHPPKGTSNTAVSELPKNYPQYFQSLRKQGPGSTMFGFEKSGDFKNNSFNIPTLPEERATDPKDMTYHKYGVLTYLGPVDASKGITRDSVVGLLRDRYSRPGYLLRPSAPDFTGRTDAYALGIVGAVIDKKNLDDPQYYTDRIGSIAQAKVPDGVVNITDTDHGVYPGTIRRTILEVDGHLYVYTQGSGSNRYQNEPTMDAGAADNPVQSGGEAAIKASRRMVGAISNDVFGPRAFKSLDHQLYMDVERVRAGKPLEPADGPHLNPDDLLPSKLPPAIFTNDQRRGKDY